VKLARAAEGAPPEMVAPDMAIDAADLIVPDQARSDIMTEIASEVTVVPRGTPGVLESAGFADEGPVLEVEIDEAAPAAVAEAAVEAVEAAAPAAETAVPVLAPQAVAADVPAVVAATLESVPPAIVPAKEQAVKRPLMWSAAVHASPDAPKPGETDQSHVPPMLRSLHKCKACGFPVSEGRALCVECDEKQWRGQPLPATAGKTPGAGPAVDFRQGGSAASRSSSGVPTKPVPLGGVRPSASSSGSTTTPLVPSPGTLSSPPASPAAPAAVVAPQSLAAALAELNEQERRLEAARRGEPVAAPVALPAEAVEPAQEAAAVSAPALAPVPVAVPVPATAGEIIGQAAAKPVEVTEPGGNAEPAREIPQNLASFDFSGGLGTSESWLGKNKYILGAILVIAGVVAGIVWLR
jgi:hypothetical protein